MHRLDLTKLGPVAEAHYTDAYGAAMRRFHDKYKDAGPEFFVNFNPVVDDPREKTIVGQQMDNRQKAHLKWQADLIKNHSDLEHSIFKEPSHHDPVGMYGYPAEYVANHWNDLQYGSDMGNLRVFKVDLSGDKVLRLSDMTQEEFIEAMRRLNLEFHVKNVGWFYTRSKQSAIALYEAIFEEEAPSYPYMRINSYGKVLFKLIQNNYAFIENKPPEEDEEGEEVEGYSTAGDFKYDGLIKVKAFTPISQQQQTKRLMKAGYEVVLDQAKSPLEATIFPDEPEQVICLTKRSFQVVEVFHIPKDLRNDRSLKSSNTERTYLLHKIAGMAAKAMKDRIANEVTSEFAGRPSIRNLRVLRHWITTEQIVQMPISTWDPTKEPNPNLKAWLTSKGYLIVVSTHEYSSKHVQNTDARKVARSAVTKARVRPGENEEAITANLSGFGEQMDKPYHRLAGSHNTAAFYLGIVNQSAEPTFMPEIPAYESITTVEKRLPTFLAGNAAKIAPWRRITPGMLDQFKDDAKKAQLVTRPTSPAKDASAPVDPKAKSPVADDTVGRPAP